MSVIYSRPETYRIVRHYFHGSRKRMINSGLTLEQAQTHCQNEETSSSTARTARAKSITRKHGPWFDGYETERA